MTGNEVGAFHVLVVGLTLVFGLVKGPQAWRRLNAHRTARFVALSPLGIVAAFPLMAQDFNQQVACPSCPDSASLWGWNLLAGIGFAIPMAGALVGAVGLFRLWKDGRAQKVGKSQRF
jgi:hypothetical protein